MLKRLLPLLVFLALGGLLLAGIRLAQTRDPNEIPSPLIGKRAPAFSLPLLEIQKPTQNVYLISHKLGP